ncbi:MurR/RpiR family transcriptional regulator [Clostridium sp. MSJ-4]|uniref:MurR/RpiR family transcriptional regulator n=1 Tax=Clostridium simiarum TaxID=2841506 RepID=A0ABS6F762_9CLOT|nr:MurR/RpiR family transcriptional regulator [Clostridium simiarum]MBU5593377.1 MurR/RpiR family transcriptional regulator [Clostridium simiarum]
MAGSIIKIRGIMNQLSTAERKVARFILDYPSEVSNLSIGEMAKKCGASEATIVRFCRIVGYDGFKDFKIDITRDMAYMELNNREDKYGDIETSHDISDIIMRTSNNNKKAIENTIDIISCDNIEKAVDVLEKANRIEFFGVGASHIIALDAFQKFARINKIANAHSDTHLQLTSAVNLTKDDVAVAISYSGETREIYDAISVAKQARATTISITKYGSNSISDICDINLYVAAPEVSIRSGATSSRIAQLNIIDILFAGVASRRFEEVQKYLERTREVTRIKKLK